MIPVIFLIISWWACSGVAAGVKASRAARNERAAADAGRNGRTTRTGDATNPDGSTARRNRPSSLGDVTFRQWQSSMFRRWKTRVRSHLPGRRLGRRVVDLAGDVTAAGIAGAAAFGAGFIFGATWAGARWSAHSARRKAQDATATARQHRTAGNGRPRTDDPFTTWPTGFGFAPGPHFEDRQAPHTPPNGYGYGAPDDDVIDAELTDDIPATVPTPSPFASTEYADLVGVPELLAHNPEPTPGDFMAEILNIHRLFEYSKAVITTATNDAEQDAIRANSAGERAEQAGNRSITAGNRAESAGLIAAEATSQATQLEETAARFSSLNMDSTSLASINGAIESANAVATAQRRRAEAEARVAALHAALAAAEDEAAAAAAESARVTMAHVEQVKNMHDTVQTHQMPHAEAQAATGNAAAHASVLAAN